MYILLKPVYCNKPRLDRGANFGQAGMGLFCRGQDLDLFAGIYCRAFAGVGIKAPDLWKVVGKVVGND